MPTAPPGSRPILPHTHPVPVPSRLHASLFVRHPRARPHQETRPPRRLVRAQFWRAFHPVPVPSRLYAHPFVRHPAAHLPFAPHPAAYLPHSRVIPVRVNLVRAPFWRASPSSPYHPGVTPACSCAILARVYPKRPALRPTRSCAILARVPPRPRTIQALRPPVRAPSWRASTASPYHPGSTPACSCDILARVHPKRPALHATRSCAISAHSRWRTHPGFVWLA